jgi:hypothetical protein
MSLPEIYAKAVHEKSGYWGTFPLDHPLEVGDVIKFDDGRIMEISNIFNWPGFKDAMPIDRTPVESASSWSRHAAKSREMVASGGATTTVGAGANAEVKVSFSEEGGFVLEYMGGEYTKLRDVEQARKWVLGLAKNGEWNKEYALVTEVVEASLVTVLVSSAQQASIVLSASASVPAELTGVNLADPKFGFKESSSDEGIYKSFSKVAYPLYRIIRIRKNWFIGSPYAELLAGKPIPMDAVFTDNPFGDDDV